jgi:hypothetical protein
LGQQKDLINYVIADHTQLVQSPQSTRVAVCCSISIRGTHQDYNNNRERCEGTRTIALGVWKKSRP